MVQYYGDFRSLDNSVDPKGQRYRVVIFTGYKGESPYEKTIVQYGTDMQAPVYTPVKRTELKMCANPFVVNYEGDGENIYKPFKCSTATVTFRQENINLDFLNGNGTSTLVMLLKYKNEVELQGRYYVNTATGQRLNKRTVNTKFGVMWDDFFPEEEDFFCYTVEWVGFSTPETFSMGYSHVNNDFTLNCQDAFSVLQYNKYEWEGSEEEICRSFLDILLESVGALGTYKKIYITDTLKLTDSNETILKHIIEQQQNNFNEDGKPCSQLDTITEILTYCGLTAIPYKDTLVLTTPNAIADGWSNYKVYSFTDNNKLMWYGGGNYTLQNDEYLTYIKEIKLNDHTGNSSISTTNVYESVVLECDEYAVENLIPDIEEYDVVNTEDVHETQPLQSWIKRGENDYDFWDAKFLLPNVDEIVCYIHGRDILNGSSSRIHWAADSLKRPIQSSDLTVTINTAHDPDSMWRIPYLGELYDGRQYCCIIEENEVQQVKTRGVLPHSSSFKRKFLFYHHYKDGESNSGSSRNQGAGYAKHYNYDDKQTKTGNVTELDYQQTMLYIKSKKVLLSENQYLNIKGDWTFYRGIYTQKCYTKKTSPMPYSADNAFIYATVKVGDYYLNVIDLNNYSWVTEKTLTKLPLLTPEEEITDCAGGAFPFAHSVRQLDGLFFKLPVEVGNCVPATIELFFDRQLGTTPSNTSNVVPTCYTLENLEVNVVSKEYVETYGKTKTNVNRVFNLEMYENGVVEFPRNTIKLSSNKEHLHHSQTAIKNGNQYKPTPNTYNTATARYSLPESHIVSNIGHQYTTPTVNLTLSLRGTHSPLTLYRWSFLSGKKLVSNSLEIDYEYNTTETTVTEVKTNSTTATVTRRNATRNYRRNGDLITNVKPTFIKRELLTVEYIAPNTRTITTTDGTATAITDNEIDSLITIQPQLYGNDAAMLISIPNDIEGATAEVIDGELIINL